MTKPENPRDPGAEWLRAAFFDRGLTRKQIAQELGDKPKYVDSLFQLHGIRTSPVREEGPSRTTIRKAIQDSKTRQAAADRLGISLALFVKLCDRYGIKGVGVSGLAASKRAMTEQMRGAVRQAEAKRKGIPEKFVGTDMLALIAQAVESGMVTRCPPAFVEHSTQRDPLSDDERAELRRHQAKLDDAA